MNEAILISDMRVQYNGKIRVHLCTPVDSSCFRVVFFEMATVSENVLAILSTVISLIKLQVSGVDHACTSSFSGTGNECWRC